MITHDVTIPWCYDAMMMPWCHNATKPWCHVVRRRDVMLLWCLEVWCHAVVMSGGVMSCCCDVWRCDVMLLWFPWCQDVALPFWSRAMLVKCQCYLLSWRHLCPNAMLCIVIHGGFMHGIFILCIAMIMSDHAVFRHAGIANHTSYVKIIHHASYIMHHTSYHTSYSISYIIHHTS